MATLAIAIVGIGLCQLAAGCTFQYSRGVNPWPSSSDRCFEMDLSGLPIGPFTVNDSYPEPYIVTSPCGVVAGGCGAPMVQATAGVPGCPAGRPLGLVADNSTAVVLSVAGDVVGMNITLTGGYHADSCQGGRAAVFNLLCDANAPVSNAPDSPITFGSGGADRCTYVVTWRHPSICSPKKLPSTTTCGSAPTMALPTANQLRYQQSEIVALTHFNMATFVRNGDPGCAAENWNEKKPYAAGASSNPATFNPTKLNTTQWAEVYKRVGVKGAVLTAKHGCGHLLWPTKVTLPDGKPYGYGVGQAGSAIKDDVLRMFSDSMTAASITHGFYYSLTDNFFLNIANHAAHASKSPLPGQVDVNQTEFERIALAQVTELWTNYGQLGEIWFDGGYGGDMAAGIKTIIAQQKLAVGFGGSGVMDSPVGWVGTESGMPGAPHIWSTGGNGVGDPASTTWMPKCCDTTLQMGDTWFFEPGCPVRDLATMIAVFHQTVGRNGVLELDFGINRDGLVDPKHVERYNEFGDWIRACYDAPLRETNGTGGTLALGPFPATSVDRIQLREDQRQGQRVRVYTVDALVEGKWVRFAEGTGIGNRQIDLHGEPVVCTGMRLTVTAALAAPIITQFAAFRPCPRK